METIQLGQTDCTISRLGLGGCPLGGHGWGEFDQQQGVNAVRKALDAGVNFFDTADCYGLGESEILLSKALEKKRHEVVIASKFGVRYENGKSRYDNSPQYVRQALEASLKRLQLDCIPLYYIHYPDDKTPIQETVAELEKCRQEGKIKAIGLSNFSENEIEEAVQVASIAAVQVQFSLLEQKPARKLFDVVKKHKISLITWGSLAQGMLTGKYDENTCFGTNDRRSRDIHPHFHGEKLLQSMKVVRSLKTISKETGKTPSQLAIRWLLDTKPVSSVLFGAKNPVQVEDNCRSSDWKLSRLHYQTLLQNSIKMDNLVKLGGEGDNTLASLQGM